MRFRIRTENLSSLQIERFIAAQAIMFSLPGLPGIYFHSLFGSRGWIDGVQQTGRNHTINREKCDFDILQNELADEKSCVQKFSQDIVSY